MSIETQEELDALRAAGRVVAEALRAMRRAVRPGVSTAELDGFYAAVERAVAARGHAVCTDLIGHGIGRRIHEPPSVPSHYLPHMTQTLTEGLVLTIEPIVSAGSGAVREASDGWTVLTADGALSAHAEHTLVIRRGEPIVLTA